MQRRSKVEEVWSKIHDVLIKFDIINTVRHTAVTLIINNNNS